MTLEELIRFHTEEAEKMKLHRKVNEIILGTETYEIKLQEHTQTAEWLKELSERRKQPEVELKQTECSSPDSELPEIKTDRTINDCISRQAVLDLVKELTFENVKGLKHYKYRCIDPDDVRELPAAKIEYDVRFVDEDHVWIDGKRQYISIRRFQEAVASAKQDQKTALWIIRKWGDDAKCSNCGKTFSDVYDMENYDGYCRFCGCKMVGFKGEQKDENKEIFA